MTLSDPPVPECEVCGSPMYVTELLQEPDRDLSLIDWEMWDCLVCEETGVYEVDGEVRDQFLVHIGHFREMARHAGDSDQVAIREKRQQLLERELMSDDA